MLELDAGVAAVHGGASLIVALDAGHSAWIEYPLPIGEETGRQRHVLHIGERFFRAILPRVAAGTAALTRVPAARVMLLAARQAPAEALRAA